MHEFAESGFTREDFVALDGGSKQLRHAAGSLRLAQQQKALGIQRIVKRRQRLFLQVRLHVNEHIAATDQVNLAKGRVFDEVVNGKNASFTEYFVDLIAAIGPGKILFQTLKGDIFQFVFGIDTDSRLCNGDFAEVCGKNLDALPAIPQKFPDTDRDGIGFLARAASCHPNTNGFPMGIVADDLRKNRFAEICKAFGVTKKGCDGNEQVLVQRIDFLLVFAQKLQIGRRFFVVGQCHSAKDTALNRRLLVVGKIRSLFDPQQGRDLFKHLLLFDLLMQLEISAPNQASGNFEDFGWDFIGRQHKIDHTCLCRTLWHSFKRGGCFVLRKGNPPVVLDRFEAERAVGGRSRKHNADGMGLMHLCQRAEKPVNRHVWIELLFGWARSKQQNPIGGDHDFVAGNHIDMIGFHLHIVGDFQDWNPRHLLQELRQHAFMARIQMLYEHVGHA